MDHSQDLNVLKKCYRIYTEDKHYSRTLETVESYFSGFTVYRECNGLWHGIQEESLVIEIITTEDKFLLVKQCAEQVKNVNEQVSVLLTVHNIETYNL